MNYPKYIMRYLRQRKGLDENDTTDDSILSGTEPLDALREVCAWNLGDRGWADQFMTWAIDCGVIDEEVYRK